MPEDRIVTPRSPEVVVVGAGAAGVAAARRLVAAEIETLVLEARDRAGGRAHTVPTMLGPAIDIGCEWLHAADCNPWVGIARSRGFTIDETLPNWGARVSWHLGEEAQREWWEAREAFDARCEAAALEERDRAESELLEPGNRWNGLIGAISTWANGTELEKVSVKDHARYENTGLNWRVLEGYGGLISACAAELPLQYGTTVERIDHSGKTIAIATSRGTVETKAVIVTIPTNLLARETIRFTPAIPEKLAACAGLPLGVADKLFLAIAGKVDDLPRDRHLIGALDRVETGGYQIRPHGWPVIGAYFGGALATGLEKDGMASFAIDELSGLFGESFRQRLTPLAQSAWVLDPFANGSYSCALPGHADERRVLAEPVDERIHFAGEACSIPYFGTAHGAFITAEAAADRVIAALRRSRGKEPRAHVRS
jgi:monoamine oxidase